MSNVIVSAHGGRWSDQLKEFKFGKGSVDFFVQDGEVLSNQEGYKILENLVAGKEPGGNVAEEISSGEATYDYSCWYAEEFKKHCGIFEVGTGKLLQSLSTYSEDAPLLLSKILKDYPGVTVYWVCCREVTLRSENTCLVNSPESFLCSV
ncbi:MAG: hypothetical protein FP813_04350 [Desulfurivibrio sp.]|nr:hypothetical protein [Desulfurivibrio sp.]MBU4034605.1 hypothetical protein [Pseudomonadota bacterium]MBU4119278.1 hypothetical protein [Pseudomonadota bacterium]